MKKGLTATNMEIILKKRIADIIKADNGREVEFVTVRKKGWRGIILGEGSIEIWTSKWETMARAGEQRFLMTSQPAKLRDKFSVCSALQKVVHYAKERHEETKSDNSYTVEWMSVNEPSGAKSNITKSYFWANSYAHAESKFYAGKNKSEYVIFSIKLNPTS